MENSQRDYRHCSGATECAEGSTHKGGRNWAFSAIAGGRTLSSMWFPRSSELACFVVAGLTLAACGGAGSKDTVQVFAAASLTDAFTQLEADFEAANPNVDVVINFGGSSSLREQIRAGAPADVFASANESVVASLVEESLVNGRPEAFATNSLILAVPAGNPGKISGLSDLANDDLLVGVCAAEVPCGQLAVEAFETQGIEASIDTNEPDVRALLTKIELGELDVGLVYTTDVLASDKGAEPVAIGGDTPFVTTYPIVTLVDAPNPEGAAAFADFVTGSRAEVTFAQLGFGAAQ